MADYINGSHMDGPGVEVLFDEQCAWSSVVTAVNITDVLSLARQIDTPVIALEISLRLYTDHVAGFVLCHYQILPCLDLICLGASLSVFDMLSHLAGRLLNNSG